MEEKIYISKNVQNIRYFVWFFDSDIWITNNSNNNNITEIGF